MDLLNIRNATIDDVEIIANIEATCFPASEAASKSSIIDRVTTYAQGFYLAELDGKIIGFINGALTNDTHIEDSFFESMSNHDNTGKNFVIFGLDVLPDFQNKGYARILMNHLIKECKSQGLSKVILTCKEHLIKYYASFGYINEGVSSSVHGGAKWYDMYLEL